MSVAAFLDTCVLYPQYVNDLFIRLAINQLYHARWSPEVFEELRRNLAPKFGADVVDRRIQLMRHALRDAEVTGYDHRTIEMTCDKKDHHVLAAAVHGGSQFLVTFNLKDFPAASLRKHDIAAVHPDDFLVRLLCLTPDRVLNCLHAQVAAYRKPPRDVPDLLNCLAHSVPRFSQLARRQL